jgi:hypothetical protein
MCGNCVASSSSRGRLRPSGDEAAIDELCKACRCCSFMCVQSGRSDAIGCPLTCMTGRYLDVRTADLHHNINLPLALSQSREESSIIKEARNLG